MVTLVVGTNSYVSLGDSDTYFGNSLRSVEWRNLTTTVREQALIEGTRYLQRFEWLGAKTDVAPAQVLDWPRTGITNDEGEAVPSVSIPGFIEDATSEVAIRLAADPGLLDSFQNQTGTNVKKVVAGDVEVEFFSPILGTQLFEWVQASIGQFLKSQSLQIGGAIFGNDDISCFTDLDQFGRTRGFA